MHRRLQRLKICNAAAVSASKIFALSLTVIKKYFLNWTKTTFKGAQVWDFDVLDFNDFFVMKSI